MLLRFTIPAALLVLTACAAAVPGYSPPPLRQSHSRFANVPESGSVTAGTYEMSAAEKALDCKHLTGSMQITISRMKDAYYLRDASPLASTTHKTLAPVFQGSSVGADRQAEYARERAKLDAYNAHLASKNCKTVDIEAELAKPPESAGKKY